MCVSEMHVYEISYCIDIAAIVWQFLKVVVKYFSKIFVIYIPIVQI